MFDYIAIVSQVELNLGTVVELVAQLRITTGRQLDRKILRYGYVRQVSVIRWDHF